MAARPAAAPGPTGHDHREGVGIRGRSSAEYVAGSRRGWGRDTPRERAVTSWETPASIRRSYWRCCCTRSSPSAVRPSQSAGSFA